MIKTIMIWEDVIQFIESEEYNNSDGYFKVELWRLDSGGWRVGIITEPQLELDV